jgi:integrase
MRRGEILSTAWKDLDLEKRIVRLEKTKNGYRREVPLTTEAIRIFSELHEKAHIATKTDRIFSISANAVRLSWERLRRRAGIEDLHFHDLRHEAISRFFEMGLSIPEVALISGHKDHRMLLRYTHLRATDLAGKLG